MRRLITYYTHVQLPFPAAAACLEGSPAGWLPDPATAVGDEWHTTLHAEGAVPAPLDAHPALVRVGSAFGEAAGAAVSISWRSALAERLLPALEAELVLAPLEGHGCQLSLLGSYRPPLSVVGAAGDRLVGQRVAEACVRRFVLAVADRLDAARLPA